MTPGVRDKHEVWWCRAAAGIMRLLGQPGWMEDYALTVFGVIYTPSFPVPESTMCHELVHVRQQRSWPWALRWLWHLAYMIFPLPVFLAWFRWKQEREAYLENIVRDGYDAEQVVEILWRGYFWLWPRTWMRRWFEKNRPGTIGAAAK